MSRGAAPWPSRRPAPAPDRDPEHERPDERTWQGWDSDEDDEPDDEDD